MRRPHLPLLALLTTSGNVNVVDSWTTVPGVQQTPYLETISGEPTYAEYCAQQHYHEPQQAPAKTMTLSPQEAQELTQALYDLNDKVNYYYNLKLQELNKIMYYVKELRRQQLEYQIQQIRFQEEQLMLQHHQEQQQHQLQQQQQSTISPEQPHYQHKELRRQQLEYEIQHIKFQEQQLMLQHQEQQQQQQQQQYTIPAEQSHSQHSHYSYPLDAPIDYVTHDKEEMEKSKLRKLKEKVPAKYYQRITPAIRPNPAPGMPITAGEALSANFQSLLTELEYMVPAYKENQPMFDLTLKKNAPILAAEFETYVAAIVNKIQMTQPVLAAQLEGLMAQTTQNQALLAAELSQVLFDAKQLVQTYVGDLSCLDSVDGCDIF